MTIPQQWKLRLSIHSSDRRPATRFPGSLATRLANCRNERWEEDERREDRRH
jgi:hypothetical protein